MRLVGYLKKKSITMHGSMNVKIETCRNYDKIVYKEYNCNISAFVGFIV